MFNFFKFLCNLIAEVIAYILTFCWNPNEFDREDIVNAWHVARIVEDFFMPTMVWHTVFWRDSTQQMQCVFVPFDTCLFINLPSLWERLVPSSWILLKIILHLLKELPVALFVLDKLAFWAKRVFMCLMIESLTLIVVFRVLVVNSNNFCAGDFHVFLSHCKL